MMVFLMDGSLGEQQKRPGKLPDLGRYHALDSASTSVVKGEPMPILGSLQIASRHFAGLVVALHVVTDFLAFDDFAHSSALDGRDVDERVSAAIVRLNEAEALGGIEPFNCASGHDEPFHSNIEEPPRQKRCG